MPIELKRSDRLILTTLAVDYKLSTTEIIECEMQPDKVPNKMPNKVKLGVPRQTIRDRLEVLHERGLIVKMDEKTYRDERKTEWFEITILGLIVLLGYEEPWDYIEGIAEAQEAKIPAIFKKRAVFTELKNELKAAVQFSLKDSFGDSYLTKGVSESQLVKWFSTRVLFAGLNVNLNWTANSPVPLYIKNEFSEKWMKMMLVGDSELGYCFREEIRNLKEKLDEAKRALNPLVNSASMFLAINDLEEKEQ